MFACKSTNDNIIVGKIEDAIGKNVDNYVVFVIKETDCHSCLKYIDKWVNEIRSKDKRKYYGIYYKNGADFIYKDYILNSEIQWIEIKDINVMIKIDNLTNNLG